MRRSGSVMRYRLAISALSSHGTARSDFEGEPARMHRTELLRFIACRYFVFMRGEGSEDFTLLTRRNLGEIEAAP